MTRDGFRSGKSRSRSKNPFEPIGVNGDPVHRYVCKGWQSDPYPTTHPYMGKDNATGPKYGNWMPHPYITDMDTLTKRFGSWSGYQRLEVEPGVNFGNLYGERCRLGMGGFESGQVIYPPVGLCNPKIIKPTKHPRHICKMDLSEDARCPYEISLGKTNPDWPTVSRPGNPWYCTQKLKPEHRPGQPILRSIMPAAGIPTTNDCPLAWRYHPANLNDPNLKMVILQKTLGQFTNPTFRPKPGDILILQRARKHATRDAGYVQFYTTDHMHQKHLWNHGDQIVRLGKLVHKGWKMCKDFKMFKLIQKTTDCPSVGRWMITGLLQREPRELVSLNERKGYVLQTIVKGFWPRRGDLLVKSDATSHPSQLEWVVVPGTGPSYRPGDGDVILRAYMQEPRPSIHGEMAGSVEMFLYDGKGVGWVFMGRDESVIDCKGHDMLELMHRRSTLP
ncbi:unnamed protein product [Calypogeia fissa]